MYTQFIDCDLVQTWPVKNKTREINRDELFLLSQHRPSIQQQCKSISIQKTFNKSFPFGVTPWQDSRGHRRVKNNEKVRTFSIVFFQNVLRGKTKGARWFQLVMYGREYISPWWWGYCWTMRINPSVHKTNQQTNKTCQKWTWEFRGYTKVAQSLFEIQL